MQLEPLWKHRLLRNGQETDGFCHSAFSPEKKIFISLPYLREKVNFQFTEMRQRRGKMPVAAHRREHDQTEVRQGRGSLVMNLL